MFKLNTKVTQTYSVKQLSYYAGTAVKVQLKNNPSSVEAMENAKHNQNCMKLLALYIRENRFDLFDYHLPYKIITNGYNEFKYVELENGQRYTGNEIFDHIRKSEKNGKDFELNDF